MTVQEYQARRQNEHMALVYEIQPWRKPVATDPEWVAALRARACVRESGTHLYMGLIAFIDGRQPLPQLPPKLAANLKPAAPGSKFGWIIEGQGITSPLQELIMEYGFQINEAVESI